MGKRFGALCMRAILVGAMSAVPIAAATSAQAAPAPTTLANPTFHAAQDWYYWHCVRHREYWRPACHRPYYPPPPPYYPPPTGSY